MSSAPGKLGKSRGKTLQSKILEFGLTKQSGEANATTMADKNVENVEDEGTKYMPILEAIKELKADFSNRFDGVLVATEGVRKEVGECMECVKSAEVHISGTEDDVTTLQAKVQGLESKNRELEDKVIDLEARSRLSNLRLVNLLEKAEGDDACSFLKAWIPEALGITSLNSKLILERAHRVGQRRDPNAPPRTMIMKFLNDRDKMMVLKAIRAKKRIFYKDQPVRFYPDLAAGIHKKQKEFDSVRQQLRNMGIRYGMLIPAKLLVTYKDKTETFDKPADVEVYIRQIQEEDKTE